MALALLSLAHPSEAQSPHLRVDAGLAGQVRPSRWMPVHVEVDAAEHDIDGELLVQWGDARAHRAIAAPAGSRLDLVVYLRLAEPQATVDTRLVSGGRVVARVESSVAVVPYDTDFRLCVGAGSDAGDACTARVDAASLPTSMRGYDAVDDVVWLDGVPPLLRADQRSAFTRWRANRRRLTMDVYTTPPQLSWKGMDGGTASGSTLLASGVIVMSMVGAAIVWRRRATTVVAGPAALLGATVLGVVAATVTGRAGMATDIVLHHATTVQQVGDGSLVTLRGTVEYPAAGRYALTLGTPDGDLWAGSGPGVDISIDRGGAGVLDGAASRGARREIELEAITDFAPFDVRREDDRIRVTNVTDRALTDCRFGEVRPGSGQTLGPGASLETREPDAREAPFFSCRVAAPPLVLTDARHPVRFDGESLAVVWLPVDRASEVAP